MHPRLLKSTDSPLDGVHIWAAQLEALSTAEVADLAAPLDATERARAARFHFERDRQQYVATRGLLRSLLGDTLNEEASKIAFDYGEHGKPRLALAGGHHPQICFNVSHSAGWAMFAVASELDVGIDLESTTRLGPNESNLSALAARILSPRELAIWQALPDAAARRAAFLRAWTRKEAFAKATGRGFSAGLAQIEIALDAAAPARSLSFSGPDGGGGLTSGWSLYDLVAPPGFAAALAVEQIRAHEVSAREPGMPATSNA